MDSWVVITVYGRDNTDNCGWLWLSVVSWVGKLHITQILLIADSHNMMGRRLHVTTSSHPAETTHRSIWLRLGSAKKFE